METRNYNGSFEDLINLLLQRSHYQTLFSFAIACTIHLWVHIRELSIFWIDHGSSQKDVKCLDA